MPHAQNLRSRGKHKLPKNIELKIQQRKNKRKKKKKENKNWSSTGPLIPTAPMAAKSP